MIFCHKAIGSRARFSQIAKHRCYWEIGHKGLCAEYGYLAHFGRVAPQVRSKIIRDATMTTGAAWKSDDAGPNRINRWAMTLSDQQLLEFGLDMSKLKPGIVAKLREKAATYEECMSVAAKLTWTAYQMTGAPEPPSETKSYLESRFGPMSADSTACVVCRLQLRFEAFSKAARGKAEIETAHKNPRQHNEANVGFAHRICNIAQGNRTVDEFYEWIAEILARVKG